LFVQEDINIIKKEIKINLLFDLRSRLLWKEKIGNFWEIKGFGPGLGCERTAFFFIAPTNKANF